MGRAGVDLFIEDGAYTTLSSAVVILVVLTLLFSSTAAIWSMSRAGDTQVAADSGALAGANVVSSYHTAATVVDASILSLGLAGFATIGTGLVAILIPGAEPVAGNMVDTGIEIIKTRNKFAKSASEGLQKIETALPYLIAARATQAVSAQDTDSVTYTGTALAVPRTSESDFAALEGSEISTDAIKDTSDDLECAAEELRKASEDTAKAKERAWLADCGGSDKGSVGSCSCMWERAKSLTDLSGVQNPHYSSSVTWEPQVALDRAKDYYHWRLTNEKPHGSSVEMKAESAARKAFYTYASAEVDRAHITENGDRVSSYIPLLPRNSDEVRATELYTDAVWPTSVNDDKAYLHYGTTCPNYKKGTPSGFASVADYDGQDKCSKCHFGVSSLGAVAAPSTSIENGFEYHFDKFKDALEGYVECRNKELELERQTEDETDRVSNAFDQAIKALSGERPRIAPPGRNGVVAFAVSGAISSPDELNSSFNTAVRLGDRGAISAAVLAPDEATAQNNVLSRFFSTLKERSGGVAGVLDGVMDVWGRLLVGYGDIQGSADELMDEMIKGLGGGSGALGSIASWLGDTVSASVAALGLEPCDLRLRKPVLTDSANVIKSPGSDIAGLSQAQGQTAKYSVGRDRSQGALRGVGISSRTHHQRYGVYACGDSSARRRLHPAHRRCRHAGWRSGRWVVMSIRMRLREERAQATVEIAVVTPVLLVLALIVYNVMIYASAVARFDRVVPDIVLAHAVAPSGEGDESSVDASATVRTQILNAMEGYDLQIEVSSEQGAEASDGGLLSLSGTFRTYTCTMHYEPWPTSLSIAGVPLGAPTTLSHERAVTVDPWRPGVVM